jgi:antitoxin MazE
MTTTLAKWGNSLWLPIPEKLAAELDLGDGDAVDIAVENGALVVRPRRRRYTIEEIVADMTTDDRGEIDWGPAVGKEVW